MVNSAPLTDTADLRGQPETSPISPPVSTATVLTQQVAPLTQTTSNPVIWLTSSLQNETRGTATATHDLGVMAKAITAPLADKDLVTFPAKAVGKSSAALSIEVHTDNTASSQIPVPTPASSVEAPVMTPISASGVDAGVTPGQSIISTPSIILAPLISQTISITTQYQTVTVTYTPTSPCSPTFNPNTTFHLNIVTIAPAAASTTTAASTSKSEASDKPTRWRAASVVFVGVVALLYGIVG